MSKNKKSESKAMVNNKDTIKKDNAPVWNDLLCTKCRHANDKGVINI